MTRPFQLMTTCVLLLAVGAAPVFGDQSCKPVVGHFEAVQVPPGQGHCPPDPTAFCTAGRVWGGLQGNYQFVMTGAIPSVVVGGVSTILFFAGVMAGLGVDSAAHDYTSATVLVTGVFIGSALWWLTLSSGVNWLKCQVNTRARTWINRISGAVIIAFGVITLLQSMK